MQTCSWGGDAKDAPVPLLPPLHEQQQRKGNAPKFQDCLGSGSARHPGAPWWGSLWGSAGAGPVLIGPAALGSAGPRSARPAGIAAAPRRPPPAAGPMASTSAEIIAFLLTISGWVLVSSTLPTDYWKVSTIDGTVITTATFWANLWKTCVTDSTGVSNCKDFPSMLALDGQAPADPHPTAAGVPGPLPGRAGRGAAGSGCAGRGRGRRGPRRCPRVLLVHTCASGVFPPKKLRLVPKCPFWLLVLSLPAFFFPHQKSVCVCGFDTKRMQANFSCWLIFRLS